MSRVLWRAATLAAIASGGCEKATDQPWDLGETRFVHSTPVSAIARAAGPEEFSIYVPLGVEPTRLALAARDSLVIGNGVRILEPAPEHEIPWHASVSSLGEASIGDDANAGAIYALGASPLLLGHRVVLDEYVKTLVPPVGDPEDVSRLRLLTPVAPIVEEFRWTVHFPGALDARAEPNDGGSATNLAPGAHGALVIGPGATVTLRGGTYFFDSLALLEHGRLRVDNATSPVYIWIRDSFVWRGILHEYLLAPNILFGYRGDGPLAITAPFRATLVAPRAAVTIAAASDPHSGAFFARAITVEARTTIEHRTFAGWEQANEPPEVVCGRCEVASEEVARTCCNELTREREGQRFKLDACLARCAAALKSAPAGTDVCGCMSLSVAPWEEEQISFDECLLKVPASFSKCERHESYRPGTCSALGYSGWSQATCGQ